MEHQLHIVGLHSANLPLLELLLAELKMESLRKHKALGMFSKFIAYYSQTNVSNKKGPPKRRWL